MQAVDKKKSNAKAGPAKPESLAGSSGINGACRAVPWLVDTGHAQKGESLKMKRTLTD